jgi:hypothetical protein
VNPPGKGQSDVSPRTSTSQSVGNVPPTTLPPQTLPTASVYHTTTTQQNTPQSTQQPVTQYPPNDVNLPYFNFAPDSPLPSLLSAPALPPPTWNSNNRIYFNINCKVSRDRCDGMSQTLNLAGWYISQVLPVQTTLLTADNPIQCPPNRQRLLRRLLRRIRHMRHIRRNRRHSRGSRPRANLPPCGQRPHRAVLSSGSSSTNGFPAKSDPPVRFVRYSDRV